MRIGIPLSYDQDPRSMVALAAELDRTGIDLLTVPEAYSFDSVSVLGAIAVSTSRTRLASSVFNTFSRTPALLAMTAGGLDALSGGRFVLGIGASGPQVVEGFHGLPYRTPLRRARAVAEITRTVWRREALAWSSRDFEIPLSAERGGSGLGKPLRLINSPVRPRIPLLLGAMGDAGVALAAELFEAWEPMFFHPETAPDVFGPSLAAGLARRGPELGPLEIIVQAYAAVVENAEQERMALDRARRHLALYVGGMGAKGANFYTDLVARFGFEAEALEVQDRYLAGDRDGAMAALPDELVRSLSLVGAERDVVERIEAYANAGVGTLLLRPVGEPGTAVRDAAAIVSLAA
ncbi:LLM class F420-dependent oxidoreductase [Microbacterium sp. NPDC055357]